MEPNFKNVADKYRELPSDNAWNRIQDKLNGDQDKGTDLKKRKPKKALLAVILVASAILFLSIIELGKSHDPKRFATNTSYNPTRLESLPIDINTRSHTIEMVGLTYEIYSNKTNPSARY